MRKHALKFLTDEAVIKIDKDSKLDALQQIVRGASEIGLAPATVILFTEKDATSQLYKALSAHYFQRLHFVEVAKSKAPKVIQSFGVTKFPTLIVVPQTDSSMQPIPYTGKLDILEIRSFLEPFAAPREQAEAKQSEREQFLIDREIRKASTPTLEIRSPQDWMMEVVQRPTVTGIAFLDPTDPEFSARMKVLDAHAARQKQARTLVTQMTWIDKRAQKRLYEYFAGRGADEGDFMFFISWRKKIISKLVGSFSADGIHKFITEGLSSGTGARNFTPNEVPTIEVIS